MVVRKAELKDLQRIQELNNELFELELANFDKYLIKDWPLSKEGKEYFENAIKDMYLKGYNHFDGYHRIYQIPGLIDLINELI